MFEKYIEFLERFMEEEPELFFDTLSNGGALLKKDPGRALEWYKQRENPDPDCIEVLAQKYLVHEMAYLDQMLSDAHTNWKGQWRGKYINQYFGLNEEGEYDRTICSEYPLWKFTSEAIANLDDLEVQHNVELPERLEKYRLIVAEHINPHM